MTHRNDDQSFEDTLDNAVRDMHQQMLRGNQPSGRAWELLAEEAGIEESQQEFAKANSQTGLASKLTRTSQPATSGSRVNVRPTSYLGWSTWLAAALLLVLVGASVNFLMPESDGGSNDSEHSIALAPGTPDISALEPVGLASPSASPDLYIPVHGPEYTCLAEPLTADQVFDIVMNPSREHVRRGSETQGPNLEQTREDKQLLHNRWNTASYDDYFVPVEDAGEVQNLVETSNQFWNCLMTGTAFQVWALMDPVNVQYEILMHYPVLRDETTLRQHIKEWGPRKYSAALGHTFPDLGNTDPIEASMYADESYGSVKIWRQPYGDGENSRARVVMLPHPDSSRRGLMIVEIEFVRAADGTWWASNSSYLGL